MIVNESNKDQQLIQPETNVELTPNNTNIDFNNQEVKTVDPDPTDPDPKIKSDKVVEYFKSQLEAAGKDYDEKFLYSYAKRKDLKEFIREFHVVNGLIKNLPSEKEADSIYNTFIDKTFIEKKNQVQNDTKEFLSQGNVVTGLEQQSTSGDGVPSLESNQQEGVISLTAQDLDDAGYTRSEELVDYDFTAWKKQITAKGIGGYINEQKYLQNIVENIPQGVFNLNESEAALTLNNILRGYSVDVNESGAGKNELEVVLPDGTKQEFRLFTDTYKAVLKASGQSEKDIAALELRRFGRFKNFLVGLNENGETISNPAVMDGMLNLFTTSEDIVSDVKKQSEKASDLLESEINDISGYVNMSPNDFYDDGIFNSGFTLDVIDQIKRSLASFEPFVASTPAGFSGQDAESMRKLSQDRDRERSDYQRLKVNKQVIKKLDGFIEKIKGRKQGASQMIGSALGASGSYANIDLFDIDLVSNLKNAGLNLSDMPTDGIKINGLASSLNTLQEIILDPTGRNDVIRGKIKIEIDEDEKAYGALSPIIKSASSIVKRNSAYNKGMGPLESELKITGEFIEDLVQGIGVGSLDVLSNIGVSISDLLQAVGMNEDMANTIVFSEFGIPMSPFPSPENVQSIKEEVLPLYDTEISDANSIGEFLSLANEPFTQSIPYMAAYAVNPGFGLSISGLSTYGGTLNELDVARRVANEDLQAGAVLTQRQKELINMDDWTARFVALSQTASEVAITRLFTYKYFKSLAGVKNFKGAKTVDNSRKIAESYARTHVVGVRKRIAKELGIEFKALATEIPEEELIALFKYKIDVLWGLDNWDDERARKLLKNTGIQSAFSASAMSKFARFGQTKRTRRAVDELIKGNITLDTEKSLMLTRDKADAAVLKLQQDGKLESEVGKSALMIRSEANQKVLQMNKRKQELIDSMKEHDKLNFLELLTRLEEQKASLDSDWFEASTLTNDVVRKKASEIKNIQSELKEIISRYPSELSYSFLDASKKSEYDEKASIELQEEANKKGGDFTITQEQISERAAKIYVQDVKAKRIENAEKFSVAESYTINDPTLLFVDIPEKEAGEFDLNTRMSQAQSKTTAPPVQTELELQGEGVDKIETAKKEPLDYERLSQLFSRLKSANTDVDLLKTLPKNQRNHIIKFFNDLDAGKDPGFGFVESILNANDIAVSIASKATDKIEIFRKAGVTEGMDGEQILTNLNAWAQKNISLGENSLLRGKGFATGDILLKTMFRDSRVGQEFYNIYRGINRKIDEQEQLSETSYNENLLSYKNTVKAYNKKNNTEIPPDANHPINSYELYMLSGAFRKSGITIGKQEMISSMKSDDKKIFLSTLDKIEQGDNVEQNQNKLDKLLFKYPEVRAQYEQEMKSTGRQDIEFSRWKNLVKQELELRKKELDESTNYFSRKKFKERYDLWKSTYDKLNFENANSFEDLTTTEFNIDFVKKLASLQDNDAALKRIKDYGGNLKNEDRGTEVPFVKGTYIPIPLTKNGFSDSSSSIVFNDDSETQGNDVNVADAAILNKINFAENLGDNLRLSPGNFAEVAFKRTKGANIDINARGDLNTMMYLLDNPKFKDIFANKNEYEFMANFFRNKQKDFNNIVNQGSETSVDIGSADVKYLFNKALKAAYTGFSATALASSYQRSSQFFSAISGAYPYLKSSASKSHMNRKAALFPVFLSAASNGTAPRNFLSKKIQNSILGKGDLSNIYSKSRTGLRNALKAEFVLGDDKKIPTSYFLNYLGIDKPKQDWWIRRIGPSASINTILNFAQNSSEKSLELWLARPDRTAANAAFEAHYIDARVKQGENLDDVNMKKWWANENKNPNIDAINEADALVAQTMRQTGSMSEAGIYNRGAGFDNVLRTLLPFQRFVSNARANFGNQFAILQDPSIPPSQKEQAKAAMQGVMQEVVSFQAVRLGLTLTTLKGLSAGISGLFLEEEDIQRYGGSSQFVGSDILPIEDRPGIINFVKDREKKYQDFMSGTSAKQKKTTEGEFLSVVTADANVEANLEDADYFIQRYALEYENKFKAGKTYGVVAPLIKDAFLTAQPFPLPDPAKDFAISELNNLVGSDVFTEFISGDLENIKTEGGVTNFLIDNFSGMYGIGIKQAGKFRKAFSLFAENKYYVYNGEYGEREYFISAGQSQSKIDKLSNATSLLLSLRTAASFVPGVPRSDFNKLGNYLQRAIENEFKSMRKDPLMPEGEDKIKKILSDKDYNQINLQIKNAREIIENNQ